MLLLVLYTKIYVHPEESDLFAEDFTEILLYLIIKFHSLCVSCSRNDLHQ